jgi:C4-dicarboxylate-specific signal transduction histidine kinase
MNEHCVDDAAFLGKLTAGATHEIRNVLSVIKESAGLMEDLLDIGGGGEFAHEEKFRKMIANILTQVERGSAVAKELNTLAHTPDERRRSVDLQQVLHCQSVLYGRFCRGREVTLIAEGSAARAYVTTDPVRLHAAVCAAIDVILAESPAGTEISLTGESQNGHVAIVLTARSEDGKTRFITGEADSGAALASARRVASSIGGRFDLGDSSFTVRVALGEMIQNET